MNPFVQFVDGGRRFVCNICSYSSEGNNNNNNNNNNKIIIIFFFFLIFL